MDANRYLPFLGRLLIGLPFAMSGLSKLGAYSATTAYIAAVGLPMPMGGVQVVVCHRGASDPEYPWRVPIALTAYTS